VVMSRRCKAKKTEGSRDYKRQQCDDDRQADLKQREEERTRRVGARAETARVTHGCERLRRLVTHPPIEPRAPRRRKKSPYRSPGCCRCRPAHRQYTFAFAFLLSAMVRRLLGLASASSSRASSLSRESRTYGRSWSQRVRASRRSAVTAPELLFSRDVLGERHGH